MTMIMSLGEVLVEIMRPERDLPLSKRGSFEGPFASGAPLIFACAAARLGADVGFYGVVGKDAFAETCQTHLDYCQIKTKLRVASGYTTGMAFVAYDSSGQRQFVFHLAQAAAALLSPTDLPESFARLRWLHITGSSLCGSDSMREACLTAVHRAKEVNALISFDPNLRPELMGNPAIQAAFDNVLAAAKVVLPSAQEAEHLVKGKTSEEACRELMSKGKVVFLKQGEKGCIVFNQGKVQHVSSIQVTEVDPTGAGDCFAGGLAVAYLQGKDWLESARFASIVGALSTTKLGPAEACPSLAEVEAYL